MGKTMKALDIYEVLVKEHEGMLHAYLLGMVGDPELAEEIAQEAFIQAYRKLNTLKKKGLLERKKIGLVNFYTPMHSRDQMVRSEMSALVSRIFDGSLPALANFLINSENIGLEEIETIKDLIKEKENELRNKKS